MALAMFLMQSGVNALLKIIIHDIFWWVVIPQESNLTYTHYEVST